MLPLRLITLVLVFILAGGLCVFPAMGHAAETTPLSPAREQENFELQKTALERDEWLDLDDVLAEMERRWERLIGEGKGSREAIKIVKQYRAEREKHPVPEPQALLNAQQAARRDGDRLGEALIWVLLSGEYLELSRGQPIPDIRSLHSQQGPPPVAPDVEDSKWFLIPKGLIPRSDHPDLEAVKLAKESLDRAIGLLTSPEDEILVAFLHQKLGEYWYEGRAEEALHHAEQALRLFKKHNLSFQVDDTYVIIGETHALLGYYEQALKYLMIALQDFHKGRLEPGSFRAVSEIFLCDFLEQYREAEQCYLRSLKEFKKSGSKPDTAVTLSRLANLYRDFEAYDKALDSYGEALDLYQELQMEVRAARILSGMADVFRRIGRSTEALKRHRQAADLYQRNSMNWDVAMEWSSIGVLEMEMGQYREGILHLVKALSVFMKSRSWLKPEITSTLSTIGSALEYLGKYPQALEVYERRLALLGVPAPEALIDMSRVEERMGNRKAAVQHLEEASRLVDKMREGMIHKEPRPTPDPGVWELRLVVPYDYIVTLSELGEAEVSIERYEDGIRHLQEALRWLPNETDTFLHAKIHYLLAFALLSLHKNEEALSHALEAIRMVEKFQSYAFFTGREKGAEHIGWSLEPIHRLATALYINLRQPQSAFSIWERGKMRVLQAMIRKHEIAFQTPIGHKLWEKRAQLLSRISRLQNQILSGRYANKEELLKDLDLKEQELEQVERTLSKEVAAFSNVFETPTITSEQVQAVLPPGAALIEYVVLGDVLAFIVQKDSFAAVPLGDSGEVEKAIRKFREAQKPKRGKPVGVGYEEPARQLYRFLLEPLQGHLSLSIRSLLIVPDGMLHLVPFEALLGPQDKFMLEIYGINYLNTAKELFISKGPLGRGLLAYGGANYSADKAILMTSVVQGLEAPVLFKGTKGKCEGPATIWPDLRGTDKEATEVAQLFGEEVRTRWDATEANFKREAPGKRYILASTHGYFSDCESPTTITSLFGHSTTMVDPLAHSGIVFSGANTGGDGYEDGYLTALEVLGLNLSGVELVALSACDTGVGELHGQEGVLGLKRAFLAAGTQSLVISLWKVPDAETTELMVAFFKHVKQGKTKMDALRNAKLKLIRQGKTLPFYWAAFVLVGQ